MLARRNSAPREVQQPAVGTQRARGGGCVRAQGGGGSQCGAEVDDDWTARAPPREEPSRCARAGAFFLLLHLLTAVLRQLHTESRSHTTTVRDVCFPCWSRSQLPTIDKPRNVTGFQKTAYFGDSIHAVETVGFSFLYLSLHGYLVNNVFNF